jgi:cytochrome c peroxidase
MRFVYHTAKKFIGTLLAMLLTTLPATGGNVAGAAGFYSEFEPLPSVAALTTLGRELFFDVSLSGNGKVACASCHDPRYAYGPPRKMPTPLDRVAPSLRYINNVPPFTEHFYDADDDDSVDQGPVGGYMWDGRAQTVHDQARLPLLSPNEMANRDESYVVATLRNGKQAARFRALFGKDIFNRPDRAFNAMLLALEVFQQSPVDFYPYTSKYDAYLRGQAILTTQEERGLRLFDAADKGNCASCHPSRIKRGAFPQFTDFGFVALGVPRNGDLPGNQSAAFFDLGLCGPVRKDMVEHSEYCGLFRTPSLRNVAARRSFFHNGVVRNLSAAVRFYAQRDSHPERWYPHDVNNEVRKFDDLPVRYHENIQRDPPFGRERGAAPTLSEAEIADIVAFLRTLTDNDVVDRAESDSTVNDSEE